MARDREQTFRNVEKLLRQGKAQAAVAEFRLLAAEQPRDLLVKNRLGDLLVQIGQVDEALACYGEIADEFARTGFLGKAAAILKKILRIDPERTSGLVALADLYAKQDLPADARAHYLRAAERCLESKELDEARTIFQKLVTLEPGDLLHRVRLAETRAAQGDDAGAGAELVELAAAMEQSGRFADAEKAYRRAGALLSDRPEPLAGIARCLAARGQGTEAAELLEQTIHRGGLYDSLAGELLVLYEQEGRSAEADEILVGKLGASIPEDAFERVLRLSAERGAVEGWWRRFDAVLERWSASGRSGRIPVVLERLSLVEPGGRVPALERLRRTPEWRKEHETVRTGRSPAAAPRKREGARGKAPMPVGERGGSPAVAAQPLATPQSPQEQDLATRQLTEAEVFVKYNLLGEAADQLGELTTRFPGHVLAHERLVAVLRARKDREALCRTLVRLALARSAAGDTKGAREAAQEAEEQGPPGPNERALLERESLLPPIQRTSAPRSGSPARPPDRPDDGDELEVVFDDDAGSGADRATMQTQFAAKLEEIQFFVEQGMRDEAAREIAAVREAGGEGPELDALEMRLGEGEEGCLADEDLSHIAAALEAGVGSEEATPLAAPPADEQSLDDVFAAFRQHVEDQVESTDYRTHLDLGIAYKEMGLLDDALAELKKAARSTELHREASTLLALCHRERGELAEAANCYRLALEAPGDEQADLRSLRYDLAEVLLEVGDAEGALDLFQTLQRSDPAFRDVEGRVRQLMERLRS